MGVNCTQSVILILLISHTALYVECANILGLMGVASPSHHIWNSAVMHKLGENGHNVTVLSVDIPKPGTKLPPNVHYIHLEKTYSTMYENDNSGDNLDIAAMIGKWGLATMDEFWTFGAANIKGIVESHGYIQLMNYPDDFKFDLVIYDYSLGPILLGFMTKFQNPPLIGISAFLNPPNTMDIIGSHYFPAYISHWTTTYDVNMTFWERFENTIIFAYDTLYRRYIYTPEVDRIMRPLNPPNTPYLGDIEKKAVLAIVNSHPAINFPEPLPPNVIECAGLQLMDPKPLPADIESFMNQSKNGAILFSLGTNVRSTNLGKKRIEIILSAMTELPQYNFMWKFDLKTELYKVPKNVLIKTFFPQRDILAHPNLKVFVTHSGGLSTQEATWRGVPMIGLPLFADQPRNLKKTIMAGGAEEIKYFSLSKKILKDTITKVAKDKIYRQNMQKRSLRFRDQPMKPLEKAIWWIEYVIRNPHPEHLRSPTLNMNFFVANSLDIFTVFLCILCVFIVFVYKAVTYCLNVTTRKSCKIKKDLNKKHLKGH